MSPIMTCCRSSCFRIEDCTRQEAKRWPGAIHQKNTFANQQSALWPNSRNSTAKRPRIDCDAGVTFEIGCQNHASRQAQTHS